MALSRSSMLLDSVVMLRRLPCSSIHGTHFRSSALRHVTHLPKRVRQAEEYLCAALNRCTSHG
jgi:hypothetical protein